MDEFFNKKLDDINAARLALGLIIALLLVCALLQIKNNKTVETLEASYSRSMYELVEYMENVETLLAKAQISSSPEYAAKTLTEIWRKADLAQSALSQIPITHISLEKVVQYLNQLSDYSYVLSKNSIEGEALTEEEFKNLKDFYERAGVMNATLIDIILDMNNGSLSWAELTKENTNSEYAQQVVNISQDSFGKIEENMQDYSGLIYDGPFSEHMTSVKPLGLGSGEVSREEAEKIIYSYADKDVIENVSYEGVTNSNISVHNFTVKLKDGYNLYFDVSVQGGKVIWFMKDRESQGEYMTVEMAKSIASQFFDAYDFENMKDTYYIKQNGTVTINFAHEQDGVICYPDLVKIKIALDTGEVLGMEAQSYYSSHIERTFVTPKISIEEARESINKNVEVLSAGKAVIPTDFKTEILTYEFKGKVEENEFLIYINVENGHEEEIFMIIDSLNGVLTI